MHHLMTFKGMSVQMLTVLHFNFWRKMWLQMTVDQMRVPRMMKMFSMKLFQLVRDLTRHLNLRKSKNYSLMMNLKGLRFIALASFKVMTIFRCWKITFTTLNFSIGKNILIVFYTKLFHISLTVATHKLNLHLEWPKAPMEMIK